MVVHFSCNVSLLLKAALPRTFPDIVQSHLRLQLFHHVTAGGNKHRCSLYCNYDHTSPGSTLTPLPLLLLGSKLGAFLNGCELFVLQHGSYEDQAKAKTSRITTNLQGQAQHLKERLAGPEKTAVSFSNAPVCLRVSAGPGHGGHRRCSILLCCMQTAGTGTTRGAEHDPAANQVSSHQTSGAKLRACKAIPSDKLDQVPYK